MSSGPTEFTGSLDFDKWRSLARNYLATGTAPGMISWPDSARPQGGFLFDSPATTPPRLPATEFTVDGEFLKLAQLVACARDDDRWDLLYRVLYRLRFESKNLLKITIDGDVLRLRRLAKNVARDIHKMHAFVRFKEISDDGRLHYVAWHQPEHRIMKLGAPFFVRRFGDRPWSIFTPDLSAHWDCENLIFAKGILQSEFPHEDVMDDIWKTYYKSIFNPARVKIKAMRAEMPEKYWQSLPEAEVIRDLIRESAGRLDDLARRQPTAAVVPPHSNLTELRELAAGCTACPLADQATQTVFGEGPSKAQVAIIGEQPGDSEDLAGRPFVGPAGQILNQALELAGFDRHSIYMTNAVKHFKFKATGPRRLHQKPTGSEMHACRPWLEAEMKHVDPDIVILLGATAGTSWLGRLPKISDERGRIFKSPGRKAQAILSWHPSAILRAASDADRDQKFSELVYDLSLARACF